MANAAGVALGLVAIGGAVAGALYLATRKPGTGPGGGGGGGPSLTVAAVPSLSVYDFYYKGVAVGDHVQLLVNTAPNTTDGDCQNLNGNGCDGTASIWDSATVASLDSSGGASLQEGPLGAFGPGLYACIYDVTTGMYSDWAEIPAGGCPGVCTQDSDCAPCGEGFTCEDNHCVFPVASKLVLAGAELALDLSVTYQLSLVPFANVCEECNWSWIYQGVGASIEMTTEDPNGFGVGGVSYDISTQVTDGDFTVEAYDSAGNPTDTPLADGVLKIIVTATAFPSAAQQESLYSKGASGCESNVGSPGQFLMGYVLVRGPTGNLSANIPVYANINSKATFNPTSCL